MVDLTALKTEITTDPESIGYAPHVATGNQNEIAALLNTVNQAITVKDTYLDKDLFLASITPAALVLATSSTLLQSKWDRIIAFVQASNYINLSHPGVAPLLTLAVSDGILTQQQVNAIGSRSGSRAEQVLGVGTTVTIDDIANALRS